MSDFTTALKSTLDKKGFDLAATEGLPLVDLDDLVTTSELFHTNRNALVWEFSGIAPEPVDPLYGFHFKMGARTVSDAANYNILRLVDDLASVFEVGARYEVHDLTGAVAGPLVGTMYITDIRVDPQMYDKDSGIRMVSVAGKCIRLG